mgnify:FL=1
MHQFECANLATAGAIGANMSSSQPNAAPTAAPSASSVNPPALADRGEALTPLQEEALLSAAPQLNSSGSFEKGKGKEAEMKDAAEPFPPPPEHNLDKALKALHGSRVSRRIASLEHYLSDLLFHSGRRHHKCPFAATRLHSDRGRQGCPSEFLTLSLQAVCRPLRVKFALGEHPLRISHIGFHPPRSASNTGWNLTADAEHRCRSICIRSL